jgi:hypothetical protein
MRKVKISVGKENTIILLRNVVKKRPGRAISRKTLF